MTDARGTHDSTILPNGLVLVEGGGTDSTPLASAELYDPATGTWTPTGSMAVARIRHNSTVLPDGRVLAVGGKTTTGATTSAELYDPASGEWTPAADLNFERFRESETVLPNGKVLVAGGLDTALRILTTVEIYDRQRTPGRSPAALKRPAHSILRTCSPMAKCS